MGAGLRTEIDSRRLADGHDDLVHFLDPEPGHRDPDLVGAGRQGREVEEAGRRGDHGLDAADERRTADLDGHARERIARLVPDRPLDASRQALAERRGNDQKKSDAEKKESKKLLEHERTSNNFPDEP